MPNKKPIVIIAVLSVLALGLGYWYGMPKEGSDERAEVSTPPTPTVVTNVVTNTLREVVTNIVTATPQPTPVPTPTPTPAPVKPRPQPTPTNIVPANLQNAIVERAIRRVLEKPTGELTKADLDKVTVLRLSGNQLADVTALEKLTKLAMLVLHTNQLTELPKGLEKLTQLKHLNLDANKLTDIKGLEKFTQLEVLLLKDNKLTSVKGLEKLTQLKRLYLQDNPDLTKAQITELEKSLPMCFIYHNATK